MKPKERNLVSGMQGDDVRELQRDLVWLGFDIPSQEITGRRFGEETRAAVQTIQKENKLKSDGVVDTKTVEVINKKLRRLKRVVRGNFLQADGRPLERAKVRAFDKDLRTETKLGEATCDAAGYFEISYVFGAFGKVAPDLVVKGFASARRVKPVAVSPVVFDADPELIINLVAGETEYRGPSEFERLIKDITPLVEQQRLKIAELVEDEKARDVTFLSSQARYTADRVVHAVLAHRHAEESRLEPEVFYAFLRQGLPSEPSALLSQHPDMLRRALVQAVKDNIIPQGFETEARLKATLESLQAWRAAVALENPPDPKQMTLGRLVKGVLKTKPHQERFMRAYAEHSGPVEGFWKKLEQDAQLARHAAELKFAVVLANLGQNYLPLVDTVRSTPGLKELKDLAGLNEDGWHALITEMRVGTPAHIEGVDDAAKARRYARSLAKAVEAAVPTEFFVARLKETDVEGKEDLLKFFQANPSFDIKGTRLGAFLEANPRALDGLADKTQAEKQLKALQRVYRLAPNFKPAVALQQAGQDSAHAISRMGQNAFVASYGQHFDDAAQAREAYSKARQVSASALALIADVNPANAVAMHAVPDTVREIPQLSALFGSLDSCSCEHCQSVYGPSAYLVDVLNFLKHRKARPPEPTASGPPPEPPSVKDVLFARRPDLGEIELTCENTNTVMPYVDLVLEVLEDAVAPSPAFNAFELDSNQIADLDVGRISDQLRAAFGGNLQDGSSIRVKRPGEWWVVDALSFSYGVRKQDDGKLKVETRGRQTSGTQPERAANPQYVNQEAYNKLKGAVYPWDLPYDQNLKEARTYLGHLRVPRHQIMEAFLPGERSDLLGSPELAAEYLGLSRKEVGLISGTDSATLWEQWGFKVEDQTDDAMGVDKIKSIDEFQRRSGLEYPELLDLLQMRFIKAGNALTIGSKDADHPDTCDTSKLELRGLDADIAGRVIRFVRLWRKLGWTMFDLDRVITALGGDLTGGFLVQLSHLSRLHTQFNLPVGRLAAFWALLDTVRYTDHAAAGKPVFPSIYDQLFRSHTGINPLDPTFAEDPDALSGNLIDHSNAIAAALQIGATDLNAMVRSSTICPQGAATALKLDNLSRLYRHVALAKALRLRIDDYLRAIELIGDSPLPSSHDPFTSTTRTVLFVETVTQVKDSGFSFAELDYLLRHQSETSSGIALDESTIVTWLQDLGVELLKGATKEAIARKLAEIFGFETRTLGLLESDWAPLMDSKLGDASKALLDPTPAVASKDFTRANFPRQFEILVRLHKISVISARLNASATVLDWLLDHGDAQGLLNLRALPAIPASPDFPKWVRLINTLAQRFSFTTRENGLLELLAFANQTPVPAQDELLDKLTERTNWDKSDLEFLIGPSGFGLTFPNDLKNERTLLRLRDCFAVMKRLGMSAEQAKNLSAADVNDGMAREVKQAVRAKYAEAQWLNLAKPLRDVLREKQRAALVAYLVTHIEVPLTQLERPHPELKLNEQRPAVRELQLKLNAAGANPPLTVDGEFSQVTQDAVVEFQNRNGIADHSVVGTSTWTALDRVRLNLRDPNDLYGHFLIDVEMDPCMMTSRIKQAISSVQLFVQRCLMNLETDVLASSETDDAWDWWKWMKNYRIWEANRKVFLYPENWIEPELRDDKSPFFKELEGELMESDLTLDTAETAFLKYVEKLDQVARLEVMGVYHQKKSELDILHVFARTQAPPHVYYYRQRVNASYWTPWENVDLDIEGDHLIPIIWNNRLFLFWPMFMEKSSSVNVKVPPLANGGVLEGQTRKYWEMKLAWSERKQGQWTSKKISSQSAIIDQQTVPRLGEEDGKLADLSKIFFYPVILGNNLAIDQLFVTTRTGLDSVAFSTIARPANPITPDSGGGVFDPDALRNPILDPGDGGETPLPDSYVVGSQNMFFFGGCYFDPQIIPHGFGSLVMVQDTLLGTARSYMSFREREETGLNLPVHRNLENSQAALALTPGQYRVTSQWAEYRVTRNPFLFQDPLRSYLIVPKLSWWDDTFIDPSEVGGVIAERSALPSVTHDITDVRLALTGDLSNITMPRFMGDRGLALSAVIALGPDNHNSLPFIRRPNTKYTFHTFYHPYVCSLISIMNRQGLDQMLRREVQLEPHLFLPGGASIPPFSFQDVYAPSIDLIAQPHPTEEMDFSFSGSYSSYNWELFFHAPLLIADRLTKNQRFEEAAKWFHYIFNPTDTSSEPAPQRYWQTKEFFAKTSEEYQQERLGKLFQLLSGADELRNKPDPTPEEQKDLQRLNDLEASIKAWRDHPFKPHLVARTRTTAYQKAVVMKYIDNLIAWGDQLFRRDTLETINEATQIYVLAAEILGSRPIELPPRRTPQVQTYNSLEPLLDAFSNILVEVEEFVPVDTDPNPNTSEQQPPAMLYFCLPKNDKLLRYWDTVADRLFKIRHCMNIEGVVRQLPLFEPPIDLALLVRGTAAGLDLNSLLNDVDTLLPGYRFNVLAQKATELCGELRSLGATLLATLEKRDAEELSLLRAKHETGMLEMIEQVREKQLDEANASLVALQKSREIVVSRYLHYQALLGVENPQIPAVDQVVPEIAASPLAGISVSDGIRQTFHETAEMTLLEQATSARSKATAASLVAAHFAPIPDISAQPMGVGGYLVLHRLPSMFAQMFGADAEDSTYRAGRSSRNAQYVLRAHEWTLQNNLAAREIMQIDKQIVAAEIRREISRHELRNHRKQMDNALEVEEFMRDKYTNQELYSWMVGQMSGVYFQAYQLAYETAKRTELCYRHELGIKDSNFIQFGYWDSLKKGLMAGEKLHHDLKRMEILYLEQNRREFELTKSISLSLLDPLALVKLRETGRCFINLPEEIFDLDYPGHYFRRIKSVSITLPCVVGPYTTISCTLRLQKSSIRINTTHGVNGYPRNTDGGGLPSDDKRFVENNIPVKAIAASNAQNDSGVFELSFRDERYLPFEGAGAISEWLLELFNDNNSPDFGKPLRQFDYSTISDAILHVKYTAREDREDAGAFKNGAVAYLRDYFSQVGTTHSLRMFNLRQEFPSRWHRFLNPPNPANGNVFELEMSPGLFPFRDEKKTLKVNSIWLLARCKDGESYTVVLNPPLAGGSDTFNLAQVNDYGRLHFAQEDVSAANVTIDLAAPPVKWQLKMANTNPTTSDGNLESDPAEVEEVLLVLGYQWE